MTCLPWLEVEEEEPKMKRPFALGVVVAGEGHPQRVDEGGLLGKEGSASP